MAEEISREEIATRLVALDDNWKVAALAARVATLTLPDLINIKKEQKNFLMFWSDTKKLEKLLLNILQGWQCIWVGVRLKNEFILHSIPDMDKSASNQKKYVAIQFISIAQNRISDLDLLSRCDNASSDIASEIRSNVLARYNTVCHIISELCENLNSTETVFLLEKNKISEVLDKSYNKVLTKKQIDFINFLHQLGNDFDYWADWYEARLRGEPLDEELARKSCLLPEEILAKSPAEINAYLKSLRDKHATEPLNQVRAIFIGFGAAGKTSVIRAIHSEPVVEGKEEMTPGIEIRDWPLPKSDIQAHLWDFGGQVMAHATHQFFLRSRCLYVLVLDGRTEINANEQAEYWLQHVRAFGGDAPVLLVGNKADQARVNLDMRYLRDKYPNIVDFYPLSCTRCEEDAYRAEFQRFRRDFIAQLQAVGTHQILFTKPHFAALEQVRTRAAAQTFLPKDDFTALCREQGIAEQGGLDQAWLLDLLDKLGVIIHFPNLPWLDSYLLNPRWLTYGVYTLLYAEQTRRQQGRLDAQSVIAILRAKTLQDNLGHELRYAPEHCRFILDALEQFEIGFPLKDKAQNLLIPALLPSDTPAHGFDKQDALAFDFDFSGFLPRHVLPGFIVRRHGEIADGVVWQNGVRLRSPNLDAEALAQADYHERRLSLWVRGSQAGRYFAVLHDDILHMLARMEDLPFEEYVHLPDSARRAPPRRLVPANLKPRTDFRDLLEKEAAGERQFTCKFGTYDLAEVLKIMPPEAREKTAGDHVDLSRAIIKDSIVTIKADSDHVTQAINSHKQGE